MERPTPRSLSAAIGFAGFRRAGPAPDHVALTVARRAGTCSEGVCARASEIEPGNQFRSETGEGGSIAHSQQAGGQVRSVASLRRVEWTASKLSFGAICARAHAELSAERAVKVGNVAKAAA